MSDRYPVADLVAFVVAVLRHFDVPSDDATSTARRMLEGDLRGMSGQGIFRLPLLNGAAFGSRVVDFTTDHETPTNTGQTIVMVRPDLFRPLAEFKAEMDERIRELRTSTPMPGRPPIRIPGDQAPQRAAAAARDGIAVASGTADRLRKLAERLGVTDHPFTAGMSAGVADG